MIQIDFDGLKLSSKNSFRKDQKCVHRVQKFRYNKDTKNADNAQIRPKMAFECQVK